MTAVKADVTELPESRVRVDAEVPAEEVERRLQQTAQALGRQLKIPGFRKGKVPPPVVVRRIGRQAVLDETLRGALGSWYANAIDAAGIVPVGDPELDLKGLPDEGEPLAFSIEVGVRPTARLGEYKGLEVGRREPEIAEDAIERELEALRERLARLETVEGAAAGKGDFVVVDFTGTVDGEPIEGGSARDELVEVGAGSLTEELDAALEGMKAGEAKTVSVSFPDDHRVEALRGRIADFEVAVKEVKRKDLPELSDDFAADAAGFDTVEELRADVRAKLEEADRRAIEGEFREAVVDAVAAQAQIDVPDALVDARARELWDQLSATLAQQGISKDAYLRISGKGEEEHVEEAKPDAERALRREAVLDAVVDAEGIEPSEEEVLAALEHSAEHEKTTARKLMDRLREAGRLDALKRDLAARKAVDVLAAQATPIPAAQAQARDALWTPEQEEKEPSKLWTPGS